MYRETIIIGAGPAGLQAGYFCKKYDLDYLMIEKGDKCGMFFDKFPHSGRLISVNKKYTGNDNKDFNLRHDWNSLLNDEGLLMTDYTEDYFPEREKIVEYLNNIYRKNNLKVTFGKTVFSVKKQDGIYYITTKDKDDVIEEFYCKKLIVATGLSVSSVNTKFFEIDVKEPIKHYNDYPKNYFKDNIDDFKNKSVCIFGDGNASFELANILNSVSSKILVYSNKKYTSWALASHYVGDLRSVYLPFMDTFALKSLNGIDNLNLHERKKCYITQKNKDGMYTVSNYNYKCECDCFPKNSFDKIIYCTGWRFDDSIFNFKVELEEKYPRIKTNFESSNNDNLFFIGELMHTVDYKQGSGGFIHGFRYLIKLFFKMNYGIPNEIINFNIKKEEGLSSFVEFILFRLNTSSDIYQMYGFLGDIFFLDSESGNIKYYSNVNIGDKGYIFLKNKDPYNFQFSVKLDYGPVINDITMFDKHFSSLGNESKSTFLHPVLKIEDSKHTLIDIVHFNENLFAEFTNKAEFFEKFVRTIKSYL